MHYTEHGKNRRLKARISVLSKRMSFQFLNLPAALRVTFIGTLIVFISLFFPWFSILDEKSAITGNAFSSHLGYVGVLLFLLTSVAFVLLLSNVHKEKIKARFPIVLHDHLLHIFFGILIFTHTLVSLYVIRGFSLFYSNIQTGDALIFSLVGSVFMIGGGVCFYNSQKQESVAKLYMENMGNRDDEFAEYKDIIGDKKSREEKNMTLPI